MAPTLWWAQWARAGRFSAFSEKGPSQMREISAAAALKNTPSETSQRLLSIKRLPPPDDLLASILAGSRGSCLGQSANRVHPGAQRKRSRLRRAHLGHDFNRIITDGTVTAQSTRHLFASDRDVTGRACRPVARSRCGGTEVVSGGSSAASGGQKQTDKAEHSLALLRLQGVAWL